MEKLRTDYEQAWNRGDTKAVAALYTEDAIWVNPQGVVTRGRAGIEKQMADGFAGSFKGTKISIKTGSSQSQTPDISISEGTYAVSGATGPDGTPRTDNGRFLNTVVKRGNAWVIAGSAAFVPQPGTPPSGGAQKEP